MHTLRAPIRVIWEITNKCNLKCAHCFFCDLSDSGDVLTGDKSYRIAEALIRANCLQVGLSGGEPLLHPDWLPIARMLVNGGASVGINTNGVLIDETKAGDIQRAGVKNVTISIDGADPDTHDQFRGMPGAWEKSIQAVKLIAQLGIDVMVNSVLHRRNMNEVLDLVRIIRETGAGGIKFMRLYPIGRGARIYENEKLPYAETKSMIHTLLKEKRRLQDDFNIMFGDNLANAYLDGQGDGFETGKCEAGRYKCVIGADGAVRPCEFLTQDAFVAGNVLETDILEIWRHADAFAYFRSDAFFTSCQVCQNACPERCPACAASTGDLYGPDPTCPIMMQSCEAT